MQELMTNFRNKYGQTIPLPKIYEDKDTSEDEDLQLGNGMRFGRKTPGGGGKGGGKGGGGKGGGKDPTPGTSRDDGGTGGAGGTGGTGGTSSTGGVGGTGGIGGTGGTGGTGGRRAGKHGRDDDDDDDDPNKCRKTGEGGKPPRQPMAHKEPRKQGTPYPPINRNLPILYTSRNKERTELGFGY